MNLQLNGSRLTISRPAGAPRIRTESHFWHQLREAMRKRETGPDRWVRVRPCNSALTSMPYGLRLGPNRKVNQMVIDGDYAIRCPAQRYNTTGEVDLQMLAVDSM